MFCTHCGAKVPEDASFCARCGNPVEKTGIDTTESMPTASSSTSSSNKSDTSSSTQSNKRSHRTLILVIAIVVLIVVLLVLLFLLFDPFGIVRSNEDAENASTAEINATSNEQETTESNTANTQNEADEFPEEVRRAINGEVSEYPTDIELAMASPDGYIIVGSSSGYMNESLKGALGNFSRVELCLARNEIYARHGRIFDTDWIQQYFDSKNWYEPKYTPTEFDALSDPLNEYEKANIESIEEAEESRNSPYLN